MTRSSPKRLTAWLESRRSTRVLARTLQGAFIAALWAAIGAAVALALVTSLTPLVGYRAFTVLTGSMEPNIGVGAIVLDKPIRPLEARPGDVVTFPDPANHGRLITHRLREITVKGGTAYMVTRGDANKVPERWNVPVDEEIGRVAYRAQKVGYLRAWVTGRIGRLGVTAIVILWGLLAVAEIWRPGGRLPPRNEVEADGERIPPEIALEGTGSV